LQRIRLKKLLGNLGIESLAAAVDAPPGFPSELN